MRKHWRSVIKKSGDNCPFLLSLLIAGFCPTNARAKTDA